MCGWYVVYAYKSNQYDRAIFPNTRHLDRAQRVAQVCLYSALAPKCGHVVQTCVDSTLMYNASTDDMRALTSESDSGDPDMGRPVCTLHE